MILYVMRREGSAFAAPSIELDVKPTVNVTFYSGSRAMLLISQSSKSNMSQASPALLAAAIVALLVGLAAMCLCWTFRLASPETALAMSGLLGLTVFVALLLIYLNRTVVEPSEIAKPSTFPKQVRTSKTGINPTH